LSDGLIVAQARVAVRKPLLQAQRRRRRLPDEHRIPRVRQIVENTLTANGTLPMFPVPDRLIVYSTDHFPSTQHAAHVLRFRCVPTVTRLPQPAYRNPPTVPRCSPDTMFSNQWAKVQLPTHVANAAFLVDLGSLERQIDVHVDAYGASAASSP